MEAVAHPGFGQEVRRRRGLRLDLLSQLVYKDAQVVDLIAVVGAPDAGRVHGAAAPRGVQRNTAEAEFFGVRRTFRHRWRHPAGVEVH